MSTQNQTLHRSAIILTCPSDWDEWIEVVKTKAKGGDIWQYVDLSVERDNLPTLKEPPVPLPKDVNQGKTTFAELDEAEKEELRTLKSERKRNITKYDRQIAALGTLRTFIQETISRTYLRYTFNCETPYDMLITLKTRVSPTDRARKINLINQYQKLKKPPQSQSLEAWLQQ